MSAEGLEGINIALCSCQKALVISPFANIRPKSLASKSNGPESTSVFHSPS